MKHLRKALAVLLAAGMALPMFCGCMGPISLDEFGYVLSIGVDQGQQKKFNISFLLQKEGESQDTQMGAGAYIVSAEGDDFFDALAVANASLPYELNFTRNDFILFSDQIASSGLLNEFLSISFNDIKLRQSTKMMVVRGQSADFFAGLASADLPNVAKRQYSYLITYKQDGTIPLTSLTLFWEAVGTGWFDIILPLGEVDRSIAVDSGSGETQQDQQEQPGENDTTGGVKRTGGLRSYVLGSALFNGNRLAGVLNDFDTELILMMLGEFENGYVSLTDDWGTVVFMLKAVKKPKVALTLGDAPHAQASVSMYAEIQLDTSSSAQERWDDQVKGELEGYLAAELGRVFSRCRELNSDAMRFGRYACEQFRDIEQWRDYAWKDHYKRMTAEFNVDIVLNERTISSHMQ